MTYRFQMGFGQPIRVAASVAVLMLSMVCANGQTPTAAPPVKNPCDQEPRSLDCVFFLVERLADRMSELERTVTNLANTSQVITPHLDRRIQALESKIVTLESQLGTMQTQLTALPQEPAGTRRDGKADGIDDIWAAIRELQRKVP